MADLHKGLGQKVSEKMFEGLVLWSILPALEGYDSGNPRTKAGKFP